MPKDFLEFTTNLRGLLPAETTAAYIVGMEYYNNLSDLQTNRDGTTDVAPFRLSFGS